MFDPAAAFFPGMGLGLSLIVAIGAQNAFVLRQGLLRSHVFLVCLICAVSDAFLIGAGVAGFGALAGAVPWFEPLMRDGGAAFLIWYGGRNLMSALRGGAALSAREDSAQPLGTVVATVLALTWLNPHVYLDTVVLLGAVSAQYDDRLAFALGAMAGSFLFFFLLGYGARFLAPMFARPRAWQILDLCIAVVMWAIAFKLLWY